MAILNRSSSDSPFAQISELLRGALRYRQLTYFKSQLLRCCSDRLK